LGILDILLRCSTQNSRMTVFNCLLAL